MACGIAAIVRFLEMRRQSMADPNRRPDLLPIIVLLAIVGLVCAGLWLFPYLQSAVERQNCVAVGREDCG
jgi:hypothetical protein